MNFTTGFWTNNGLVSGEIKLEITGLQKEEITRIDEIRKEQLHQPT